MLPERLAGYLRYIESIAQQPPNHWNGFYVTQLEHMAFGLRFQLAFASYALAALARHPAVSFDEQARARDALAALITRMQQRRVWAYWAIRAAQYDLTTDPVAHGNAEYSAHLAMMLGAYRAAGGDDRFDEPFGLRWAPEEYYSYSHHSLIETLAQQMRATPMHAVESTPEEIRVTCMCFVLWALRLYDQQHNTTYAALGDEWLAFVQKRLLARAPRLLSPSVFIPTYQRRPRILSSAGMSVVDAQVLAALHPLYPDFTTPLVERFLRNIRHDNGHAYVPTNQTWERREVSDQTLATAFAYLLAVELDDHDLANALLAYTDATFAPTDNQDQRSYTGGLSALYTTAVVALGEAGGLDRLLHPQHTLPPQAPPAPQDDVSETHKE